ncbi:MAG: PD-(D/E)XK nuclease family protein [Chloroflexi bacterium]|nr:PD-(D/E)XK nuclease family protein [Chloroflexota bacterium]
MTDAFPTGGPFSNLTAVLNAPKTLVSQTKTLGLLPDVFQFSQNSLQDYVDCKRRFQLRYAQGRRWPAAPTEPLTVHEERLEQGAEFHLLVQRHLMGLTVHPSSLEGDHLALWWDNFIRYPIPDLPQTEQLPEVQLSTPIGSQRLLARFDLLAIEPGERIVIADWKTTHSRPSRQDLNERLQTRVYLYTLVEAGEHLFGGPIQAEQVSLTYWFAEAPQSPITFDYDSLQHAFNKDYLADLIAEIMAQPAGLDEVWPLTSALHQCKYCVYRSLCNRGEKAGRIEDADASVTDFNFDFDFDLDTIEAIAF